MYQFWVGNLSKGLESKIDWIAPIALGVALVGIASASILIAIAETEIQPNAITCDRLLIAAATFGIWNSFNISNHKDLHQTPTGG